VFDRIDARLPTPLYDQIASRIRLAIASGELRAGEGLPSVRQLAARLRVNPATIVQAYRELESEGFVKTRHGAGTFVNDVEPEQRTREKGDEARRLVREMLDAAARLGLSPNELLDAFRVELEGVRA
jgi:GntR family transcriptional regulator